MKQGWEYKKLGEVCDVLNGFAFKSERYVNEGIRVLRITNVQKGCIVDNDPKFYPHKEINNLSPYILKKNDLLMSLTGNVGRVGLLQENMLPAALNQRVACLRVRSDKILIKFLFHGLNSDIFEKECINNASGVAQKNMSTEWLKKYIIPIPPISEQQQIVSELDLLSGVIEKQKAQLEELDKLAQSIFCDMFGDPVLNDKGWELKTLKELSIKFSDGPFGSNLKSSHYRDIGVRVIRLQNIGVNEFIDLDKAFITKEHYKDLEKYTCYPGDVIIGTLGDPNLRACIIPQYIEKCINKADCVLCRVNPCLANAEYICSLLNCESLVKAACLLSHGETRTRISAGQLRDYKVPLPPLTLQQEFAAKVEQIESMKAKVRQSLTEAETLFNSRMDYYFN